MQKETGTKIVKKTMSDVGMTQVELCAKLGYKSQATISAIINSTRMSLDKFIGVLNVMGKHVYVGDENGNIEYEVEK